MSRVVALDTCIQQGIVRHGVQCCTTALQSLKHIHGALQISFPAAGLDHGQMLADIACSTSKNTLRKVIAATLHGRLHDDIPNLRIRLDGPWCHLLLIDVTNSIMQLTHAVHLKKCSVKCVIRGITIRGLDSFKNTASQVHITACSRERNLQGAMDVFERLKSSGAALNSM